MKKETIDIIREKAEAGKDIPTAVIEYNVKLPKNKYIKKDNFFGVKAKLVESLPEGTVNLTYKMQ